MPLISISKEYTKHGGFIYMYKFKFKFHSRKVREDESIIRYLSA